MKINALSIRRLFFLILFFMGIPYNTARLETDTGNTLIWTEKIYF